MENVSVERNKNALFLVLTHIATKNEADLRRLEEEAQKQFDAYRSCTACYKRLFETGIPLLELVAAA